MTKIKCKKERM